MATTVAAQQSLTQSQGVAGGGPSSVGAMGETAESGPTIAA
jgi:hypothetical protein